MAMYCDFGNRTSGFIICGGYSGIHWQLIALEISNIYKSK